MCLLTEPHSYFLSGRIEHRIKSLNLLRQTIEGYWINKILDFCLPAVKIILMPRHIVQTIFIVFEKNFGILFRVMIRISNVIDFWSNEQA